MSPLPGRWWLVVVALCTLVPRSALADDDSADADNDDAGALVSAATPPLDSAARDKLERDLSRLLADPQLGFCKDPEVARAEASNAACQLARAHAQQRCPALEQACSTNPPAPAAEPPAPSKSTQKEAPLALPSALGTVLFWGLLFLLAVFVVRLLLPLFDSVASTPTPAPQKPAQAGTPAEPRAAHETQESDVDRLLARAEKERKQGRFETAIATLYAALVHKLGQDQLITVEAARTNGDYLHELARRPKLQGSVRQVFRAVERVQFGRSEPSDEVCEDLLKAAFLPIVKRGAALLLLLALVPSGISACSLARPRFAR